MTMLFDSRGMSADTRAQRIVESLAKVKVPVALDVPTGQQPVLLARFDDIGSLRICSLRSNVTQVNRSARMTGDDFEPSVFLALQKSGTSIVVQDGRETVLRPGELVLFDTTAPFTLLDEIGIRQFQIRIPLRALGVPVHLLRAVSAQSLSPEHPIADLAWAYFHRMSSHPALFSGQPGDAINAPSIELIRAMVATHLDSTTLLRESMHETLSLRIMEFVRAHLGDPDLSATVIASEHHISVRHLYGLLAARGISLGTWIRTERLQRCHAELARNDPGGPTVAAIARRWGFTDASSFGRQFRAEYGMTPRDWRRFNAR
jgi:AraC-like DNA-binding protein